MGRRRIGHLLKRHKASCDRRKPDEACRYCPWRLKYGTVEVVGSAWLGQRVDPCSRREGEKALAALVKAVDDKTYERGVMARKAVAGLTLSDLIAEWTREHAQNAQKRILRSNSLSAVLGVLDRGLGAVAISDLAEEATTKRIAHWLMREQKAREWEPVTRNKYRQQLHALCAYMVETGRLIANPVDRVPEQLETTPDHFKVRHLEEPVEARLFAVVDQLNRVQHGPTRSKLTQAIADTIRAQVLAGARQVDVAARFKISTGLCCQIVKGEIWNPATYRVGRKGDEMRYRLIGAFDTGMRASEMLRVQIKHVVWKPITFTTRDGRVITAYEIKLPPEIAKGGATTGEIESVYVVTPRGRAMLDQRRLALKNKPEAYLFGTIDGQLQKGFKRMWHEVFTLAGLTWGRDVGLVWHTIRHEYISRMMEQCGGDPSLVKELARHVDIETTMLYSTVRRNRLLEAASGGFR